MITSDYTWVGE